MDIEKIPLVITELKDRGDKLLELLKNLCMNLSKGFIPDGTEKAKLDEDISFLQQKYDEAYNAVKSISGDMKVKKDYSYKNLLEDYREALQNMLTSKLDEYFNVFELFVSVKSKDTYFANALQPFQTAALQLLEHIKSLDDIGPETKKLDREVDKTCLFLSAIDSNLPGEKFFNLINEINGKYNPTVGFGLSSHYYYLPDGKVFHGLQFRDLYHYYYLPDGKEKPEDMQIEEKAAPEPPQAEQSHAESNDDDIAAAEETEAEEKKAEPEHEISEFISPLNRLKTSNPSASSFEKDLSRFKGSIPNISFILPLLTHFGALTANQMYYIETVTFHCPKENHSLQQLEEDAEALADKGWLAAYPVMTVDGEEKAYCLSPYCYSCITKKSISQKSGFWKIKIGKRKFLGTKQMDRKALNDLIIYNLQLSGFLVIQHNKLSKEDFRRLESSIHWVDDHYTIEIDYEGGKYNCYVYDEHNEKDLNDEEYVLMICVPPEELKKIDTSKVQVFCFDTEKIYYVFDGGKEYPDGCRLAKSEEPAEEDDSIDDDELFGEETEEEDASADTDTPSLFDDEDLFSALEDQPEKKEEETSETTEPVSTPTEENIPEDEKSEEEEPPIEVHTVDDILLLKGTPTDADFCTASLSALNRGSYASSNEELRDAVASALLIAESGGYNDGYTESKKLALQLQLASNMLLDDVRYSNENMLKAFPDFYDEDKQSLLFAAFAFAMLHPAAPFDYQFRNLQKQCFDDYDHIFPKLSSLKNLFRILNDIQKAGGNGFTPNVIKLMGNAREKDDYVKALAVKAKQNFIVPKPQTKMKNLPKLYNEIFGEKSDIYECLEVVAENKVNDLPMVMALLSEYCDAVGDELTINQEKVENKLNYFWDSVNPQHKYLLQFDAKDKAIRLINQKIDLLMEWADNARSAAQSSNESVASLRGQKQVILTGIEEAIDEKGWEVAEGSAILSWMLLRMKAYLSGTTIFTDDFSSLLRTGLIPLVEDGKPWISAEQNEIRFYEPWRRVLAHIKAEKKDYADVTDSILNSYHEQEGSLLDNLNQLERIGRILGNNVEDYIVSDTQIESAEKLAEDYNERFQEYLELAYTKNQIDETEKENISALIEKYKPQFYDIHDYACWRDFFKALRQQITVRADEKIRDLSVRIRKEATGHDCPILNEALRMLRDDKNYAVAEEYLNRFDNGETDIPNEYDSANIGKNYFAEFIEEKYYESLYRECSKNTGKRFSDFSMKYFDRHTPDGWSKSQKDSSRNLLSRWPAGKGNAKPQQMEKLFSLMGFDVKGAKAENGHKEEVFRLSVKQTPKRQADYPHPIAAFGTRMKPMINVILIFGTYTEKQLVDTITSMDFGDIAIVLYDKPLSMAQRRNIGEIFHTQTTRANKFLLIDQVLMLYIAMHQQTERISAMLSCTLPFTAYQPFVRGAGSTPDEMFCGRTKELASIMDPNGASVVYGGRQLGKTALLERAESRCNKPENLAFAVYVNIMDCRSEAELLAKITSEIDSKTNGEVILTAAKNVKDFCDRLGIMFKKGEVSSFLLLLDEADNFLKSIAEDGYRELNPLIDLKRKTDNAFKFVLAGLHNVCRAKNATANNGPFGQLGDPLCVRPLKPNDGLMLLSRPLKYLGFQIDLLPHLETILTNTNYYPGIIQFFGYKLLDTITEQYAKYYKAADKQPPFALKREQLGSVMNGADLNNSINEKIRLTLDLDSRFFMLARCITMLYHIYGTRMSTNGFSVEEIKDMADSYEILCLAEENRNSYIVLLDEMAEMGILSSPKPGCYRLRRSTFVNTIGSDMEELEKEIIRCNEEAR